MKKLFLLMTFSLFANITYTMSDAAAADKVQPIDPLLETLRGLKGDYNWPNRKEIIMQLIEKHPRNVDIQGYNGNTPLSEAILLRDLPFTRYLLQHNADVNKENSEQKTPLYETIICLDLAIRFHDQPTKIDHYTKLVSLLIFNGAEPDYTNGRWFSPRQNAIPEIQALIAQAEQEHLIKKHMFLTTYITKDPAAIVIDFLGYTAQLTQAKMFFVEADKIPKTPENSKPHNGAPGGLAFD